MELKADILEDAARWTPAAGAPQGAVLSPLLSNVHLDPLDHLPAEQGFEMVRYADDFVILCRTAAEAARALEIVRRWVAANGLALHPTKTRIVDYRTDRFVFLGYTFPGDACEAFSISERNGEEQEEAELASGGQLSFEYSVTPIPSLALRAFWGYRMTRFFNRQ